MTYKISYIFCIIAYEGSIRIYIYMVVGKRNTMHHNKWGYGVWDRVYPVLENIRPVAHGIMVRHNTTPTLFQFIQLFFNYVSRSNMTIKPMCLNVFTSLKLWERIRNSEYNYFNEKKYTNIAQDLSLVITEIRNS